MKRKSKVRQKAKQYSKGELQSYDSQKSKKYQNSLSEQFSEREYLHKSQRKFIKKTKKIQKNQLQQKNISSSKLNKKCQKQWFRQTLTISFKYLRLLRDYKLLQNESIQKINKIQNQAKGKSKGKLNGTFNLKKKHYIQLAKQEGLSLFWQLLFASQANLLKFLIQNNPGTQQENYNILINKKYFEPFRNYYFNYKDQNQFIKSNTQFKYLQKQNLVNLFPSLPSMIENIKGTKEYDLKQQFLKLYKHYHEKKPQFSDKSWFLENQQKLPPQYIMDQQKECNENSECKDEQNRKLSENSKKTTELIEISEFLSLQ